MVAPYATMLTSQRNVGTETLIPVNNPLERLLGISGFATEMTRSAQTLGRGYNAHYSY